MLHFPEQNECGFVYFRNDDQLFDTVEMNRDFYPFSNENSIQFPLPENGPMMEKVILNTPITFSCHSFSFHKGLVIILTTSPKNAGTFT